MSLWLAQEGPARPRLAGDGVADVAVVGAGIAGLSTAYALAREGARVIVLEGRRVASAASGRNAGFVLAGVAENFVAACRRYGGERASRVWRFTTTSRVLLGAVVRREGIACDLAWDGSLQVAGDDEEWAEIVESARQLGAHGVRVALDEPGRAARYEDDGELHPVRFVRGLADACERLGVAIHETTPVRAVRADAVVTASGTVRAGAVVVCANAYTEHLLPGSRIRPVRGQMLATAPVVTRHFARPTYAHRGYRYWRQTAEGRVLVGGWRDLAMEEETGEEERTTERIQSALEAFLRERGIAAPIEHRWAGIMGFSHDGLPYLGRRADGIYLCGGFTGHGMGLAVAAGELVASLVRAGRHPDADLFDPERP